jgi:DNA topoisomerase-1
MANSLIIVESPTKAKTITKYLGKEYEVVASMGHIKDLPENELGIDIANRFKPKYVIIPDKRKTLAEIKKAADRADVIFLAPDPDREGEAICWHLATELGKKPIHRLIFHEITKDKVKEALSAPQSIDKNKVDAQQVRRILDRLVGYKVSPILGQKVRKGLSAGRVQTVALRLVCEREEEIEAFVPEEYWSITAKFSKDDSEFEATLSLKKNERIKTKEEADRILDELSGKEFVVAEIVKKKKKRSPNPPFITSKLQQEAYQKMKWPVKKTMLVAQQLYEGIDLGEEGPVGLITYIRTDSVRVADKAVLDVREYIEKKLDAIYLPKSPKVYKNKNRAQDAHEAIRPTSPNREPEGIKRYLTDEQFKLYSLVFKRFVASQMKDAEILVTDVKIKAGDYIFTVSGSVINFDGFMSIWEYDTEKERFLPELNEGEKLNLVKLSSAQHFTQPPPRYTEGTLIKRLEENGVGRPSTYAAIMSTIFDRSYVERKDGKLFPTQLGRKVWRLLKEGFPGLFEVEFTAKMEEDLDRIEEGRVEGVSLLSQFWEPFSKTLEEAKRNLKKEVIKTEFVCEKCGLQMVVREGRFGRFLACSGFPRCKNTRDFVEEDGIIRVVEEEKTDRFCPKCKEPIVIKRGREGRFFACIGFPKCRYTEPIVKVSCPKCKDGLLVFRKSKRGSFYGCNRFPSCRYTTQGRFLEDMCPNCKNYLIEYREKVFCLNCNYTKPKSL